MKQIKILYNDVLNDIELESASELMDGFGHRDLVENLNWKETYPYRPITLFNIARSNNSIFIKYSVRGSMLRAIYSNDLEPVNEDSCVEFFCKLPDSDNYMNFEFNCIGTCNASKRKSKTEGVVRYTLDELAQIKRYPSIGRRAFNEMEGMFEWELTVKIPFTLMSIDPTNLPKKMMGNFYKCADGTDSPHYVSWSPIKTEKPNFHCPEFFGELIFE